MSLERPVRTLNPEVARKIAAGEVIDRPNAIIRELMDNAIDAGATSITVEISGGGIDKIRIIDDGVGFVNNTEDAGKGLGLNSMQYRANQIGAGFVIKQNKPSGTCVQLSISNKLLEVRTNEK